MKEPFIRSNKLLSRYAECTINDIDMSVCTLHPDDEARFKFNKKMENLINNE